MLLCHVLRTRRSSNKKYDVNCSTKEYSYHLKLVPLKLLLACTQHALTQTPRLITTMNNHISSIIYIVTEKCQSQFLYRNFVNFNDFLYYLIKFIISLDPIMTKLMHFTMQMRKKHKWKKVVFTPTNIILQINFEIFFKNGCDKMQEWWAIMTHHICNVIINRG